MNGLFWFRYDLRLHDNPALVKLAQQCEQLVCVYAVDTQASMGAFRWQFIRESLADLQQQLAALGQTLVIRVGQPDAIISELIQTHGIQIAGATPVPATYEQRQLTNVKQTCPQCQWVETESFTLFDARQLPFNVNKLPDSFTPFRKQVEQIAVAQPLPRPSIFPRHCRVHPTRCPNSAPPKRIPTRCRSVVAKPQAWRKCAITCTIPAKSAATN
ncbi:deoxyribodipyrimidine photo-lyase [Thiothrix subterranea]|uniref:deoxyribodipyrimidine photo-lyase n=1 Tax=Thiothrix subterranea TaxID=2735563 RepID=UPI00280B57F7|nr:deoxyribodipyrimidine photo-lyase [Thiothrix subterranea]